MIVIYFARYTGKSLSKSFPTSPSVSLFIFMSQRGGYLVTGCDIRELHLQHLKLQQIFTSTAVKFRFGLMETSIKYKLA